MAKKKTFTCKYLLIYKVIINLYSVNFTNIKSKKRANTIIFSGLFHLIYKMTQPTVGCGAKIHRGQEEEQGGFDDDNFEDGNDKDDCDYSHT